MCSPGDACDICLAFESTSASFSWRIYWNPIILALKSRDQKFPPVGSPLTFSSDDCGLRSPPLPVLCLESEKCFQLFLSLPLSRQTDVRFSSLSVIIENVSELVLCSHVRRRLRSRCADLLSDTEARHNEVQPVGPGQKCKFSWLHIIDTSITGASGGLITPDHT